MPDITITYEDLGSKARYIAQVTGHEETGELTVSKVSDKMVIADHTGVPDSLRGTGVARALVERLIEDARSKGQKIIPLCPYVKAQSLKYPEWRDVIQG